MVGSENTTLRASRRRPVAARTPVVPVSVAFSTRTNEIIALTERLLRGPYTGVVPASQVPAPMEPGTAESMIHAAAGASAGQQFGESLSNLDHPVAVFAPLIGAAIGAAGAVAAHAAYSAHRGAKNRKSETVAAKACLLGALQGSVNSTVSALPSATWQELDSLFDRSVNYGPELISSQAYRSCFTTLNRAIVREKARRIETGEGLESKVLAEG